MTDTQLLAERQGGIGGSDIASVLNVGYGCPLRLYRQKRGECPDFPRNNSGPMAIGKLLEPWIADKFAERNGCDVSVVPMKQDPVSGFLIVHADRLYRDKRKGFGVLEIKALGSRVFYEMKQTGLAIDYILQLYWGAMLWGADRCAFAVANRDTGDVIDWEHVPDMELCELAKSRAVEFWAMVQASNPPDRLNPDDKRCQSCEYRRSCQGDALIHIDPKAKMENDESMRPLLAEYSELKGKSEIAEEALETNKAMIRDAMGDRVAVQCAENKIYFKPATRRTWDVDAMGRAIRLAWGSVDYDGTFLPAAPAEIEQFKKEGASYRSLRIY